MVEIHPGETFFDKMPDGRFEKCILRKLPDGERDKAAARGFAEDPAIEASYRSAHDVLWTAPTDLTRGQAAVDRYLAEVNARFAPSIAEGDAR